MIALGLDICEIARIEKAIEKNDGFLRRYYTQEEQHYLQQRGNAAAQSAAAMFAAKEAFLKALGVGLSGGIALSDIGITHDALHCPAYALSEKADRRMREKGAKAAFVSLSHDVGMAAAVCILE